VIAGARPSYDPVARRLGVRVVYDGAASAGKSTNLSALAEALPQAVLELRLGEQIAGTTVTLDWLRLRGGVHGDVPVIVEAVCAPSARALAAARAQLLRAAHAIVVVCDATPRGVRALRAAGTPDGPRVWQANKQDLPGASAGSALVAALGRPDEPVIEASAPRGKGIVDTFLAALRVAAEGLRGSKAPVTIHAEASARERLTRRLARAPVDGDAAAELWLRAAAMELARGRA